MNLPPVEAIDTIYRFALQQPRWRQLPQCWRFPLLQYIPFPRVAEVRGCCRISLQQRPSSRLLALGRRPSLAFLVRREPSTANTLCLVHHDCAHDQATHVRDERPLPTRSDGAAHCRSTTCDVATACARRGHGATVHVPLPTGPSLAPRHVATCGRRHCLSRAALSTATFHATPARPSPTTSLTYR